MNIRLITNSKDCKPLLDKLHKYQVTNDLTDKIFNMNCITYALEQSGKFDQKTIDNIKVTSYARYVSQKDLDKLGEQFHIAFKVAKYREDTNQMQDITRGRKIIGCADSDATLIELALIDKHYILNETVEGVTKYALEHYEQLKTQYPNASDEWILSISRIKRGYADTDKTRAHIKSYDLVKLATSNHIAFNYE